MDNPYSSGQHSSDETFSGCVVTMASPPDEKVRLFRAMFRGREDVYARRYVSAKSGKSGYLVVRFLAEDVTKRLPQVVEELSAALASRRSP